MNHDVSNPPRTWEVLLLGGPSGAGKTRVSYRLAQHFGVGLLEIDDLQTVLQEMTTPEQLPLLHIWGTRPEIHAQSAELIFDQILAIAEVMTPALEAVIAKHLRTHNPLILDGDLILPSLVTEPRFAGNVRGVFLYEDDEAQLVENFARRDPGMVQTKRARVSWLYGQWLKQEAERSGITLLRARPWETVLERIVASLG
jgi:2-phosphoglycerate kinase